MKVTGVACLVQFYIKHLLGDGPAVSIGEDTCILYGVFQIEENAGHRAGVPLIDKHCTAPQQIPVAFQRQVKDPPVFSVAYVVRAVSPGKYVLPQAYVEDMYNPSRYGRSGTGSVEVFPAK